MSKTTTTTTTKRGAPKRGEPSARERLVETAIELFYQHGIRAIGIDAVLERSGVSKSSLYRTFASKDELIAAFADEQNRRFWAWWDAIVDAHAGAPRRQLDALFDGIADLLSTPRFRGCPFVNLATEFPDRDHPGTVIACANKAEVRARLHTLCRALAVDDPVRLGNQLSLLMEGAYASALTFGVAGLKAELVDAARRLIDSEVERPPVIR
ncbi:TetR/AcrR family transcriptional regulator [Burkholderia cepacia]|uniref:TetR/AcrR family transcriptional regulator n=1 Tax=Burkholderia cepacia TaxID=292 RepID=UPI00249F6999|nr:TetR/AcrR family transcriptional regulator [Burkholderia cepacia]WGY66949.1 TetR/AcrR family transcriptional regulator [Burkholderia cepacia]